MGNSSAIPALPNSDFLPNLSFTTSKRGASDGTIQNSSPSTKPGNLTVAIPNSSSPSKIGFPDITSSNSSSSTVTKHNALTLNTPSSSSPTTVKHGNLNAITPSSSSPKAAKGGFSNMTSLNSCSSQLGSPKVICKVPKLPSMLLWIDNDNCDQKALDYIQKNHPILEIKFLPTFHEAETYLDEHLRDIEERKKFVAICRGYYAPESKNFIDVTRLFEPCASETFKLLVYTSSKVKLLEKTSKPPQGVEIFEKRQELLDFIDSYLVEEMKF